MREFMNIVEALREWANTDDLIEQALSLTMQMSAAHGFRKGDDTEFREWCKQRLRAAYDEIMGYVRGVEERGAFHA